ncbi:MAG: sulfatase [Planctomycetaceae bacterium]
MLARTRFFAVLTLLCLAVTSLAEGAPTNRPNIVFVFCDDLTCQALSSYGDSRKLLETPHIDRLAREGVRFDRCLVTNSICGPSRATILTGKYSHKNGFYNNSNCTFDGSQLTFPKLLQQAGYSTAIIGKWHLGSQPTGFDHWQILPGQGVYYNPPMTRNGQKVGTTGYVTDIITDLSIEWLQQRDRDRPFLLMCQHKAPHREWSPALRHLGWDADRQYPEPPHLFDPLTNRSRAVREHDMGIDRTFTDLDVKRKLPPGINTQQREAWDAYYSPRNQRFDLAPPTGDDLVRWRYNRYMHDYLGCVKGVDEGFGRLLKYLDDEGLTDNTLVVLTSDQGFFLGEHGWFDKRWIFEESLRTPLLVRWPGVIAPDRVDSSLVSLLDLPETFLQAAGLPVPAEMQGRSLLPLFKEQRPADWRTSFYYHYYEFPQPHHVRPHRGVVTDRYKLVHYYGPDLDEWELLDRQIDPLELKSFHADPAYAPVVADLKRELDRLRAEFDDTADPPRMAFGNEKFAGEKKEP